MMKWELGETFGVCYGRPLWNKRPRLKGQIYSEYFPNRHSAPFMNRISRNFANRDVVFFLSNSTFFKIRISYQRKYQTGIFGIGQFRGVIQTSPAHVAMIMKIISQFLTLICGCGWRPLCPVYPPREPQCTLHSVTDKQTEGRRTYGRHDAYSRSYCVTVRSAKMISYIPGGGHVTQAARTASAVYFDSHRRHYICKLVAVTALGRI